MSSNTNTTIRQHHENDPPSHWKEIDLGGDGTTYYVYSGRQHVRIETKTSSKSQDIIIHIEFSIKAGKILSGKIDHIAIPQFKHHTKWV